MKKKYVLVIVVVCCVVGQAFCQDSDEAVYRGRIVNEDGKPVAGAEVRIYDIPKETDVPCDAVFTKSVKSDSEGHFSFSRNNKGNKPIYSSFAIIKAYGYPDYYLYYGYLKSKPKVILPSAKGKISGIVVDSKGEPVAGAAVYACIARPFYFVISNVPEMMCQTDEKGQFSFNSFSNKHRVDFIASKKGYAPTFTFKTYRRPEGKYYLGKRNIKIVLNRPASISGQLVRKDLNKPLANERISIVRSQPGGSLYTRSYITDTVEAPKTMNPTDSQTLKTDSNGRFSLNDLYPGDYTIFHHNYIKGLFTPMTKVRVEEGSDNQLTIESVAGDEVILAGSLNGRLIKDHEVKVILKREKVEGETRYTYFWDNPTTARLDSKGNYHFRVPAGQYKVAVVSKTVDPKDNNMVIKVPSSQYPPLSLSTRKIEKIKYFKGVCLDKNNNPVAKTKVYLMSDPNNVVYTDSKGQFALPFRPEENKKYFLDNYKQIKKADRNFTEIDVYFETVDDLDPGRWKYRDVFLVAENKDRALSTIYDLYAYNPMKRSLDSGRKSIRRLKLLPCYTVKGLAVDERLEPVKGARVELRMQDRMGETYNIIKELSTDKNGDFSFDCISPGKTYTAVVTKSSGQCRMKSFGVMGSDVEFVQARSRSGKLELGDFVISSKSYAVSGIVVDNSGRPVSAAKVYLSSPNQGIRYRYIKADKDGRFSFNDLSLVEVRLSAKSGKASSKDVRVMPGKKDIRIVLKGAVPGKK